VQNRLDVLRTQQFFAGPESILRPILSVVKYLTMDLEYTQTVGLSAGWLLHLICDSIE